MEPLRSCVYLVVVLSVFCSSTIAFDAVKDVSVEAYFGLWYQTHTNVFADLFAGIADSECVTATYGPINSTFVSVYNAYKRLDGFKDEILGFAYFPDISEPGKLLVRLDGEGFDAPYWIFKLGPIVNSQYQYSIISDSQGLALFVLCRDPTTFDELYEAEVLEYLSLTGFTGNKGPIKEYQGSDCDYPPFDE